jgi:hypothetical protein
MDLADGPGEHLGVDVGGVDEQLVAQVAAGDVGGGRARGQRRLEGASDD